MTNWFIGTEKTIGNTATSTTNQAVSGFNTYVVGGTNRYVVGGVKKYATLNNGVAVGVGAVLTLYVVFGLVGAYLAWGCNRESSNGKRIIISIIALFMSILYVIYYFIHGKKKCLRS